MHNEVLKNLVLGGVGSITVMDDKLVNQKDLQAQFLLNDKCSVGKNRAEAILPALMDLNPKVSVSALTGNLMDKPRDFFEQFDIVSVSDYGYQQMIQLDRQCREVGVKFYASDATCGGAWVFCDAGQHSYQK
jgi:ubiquitin-like 1-activating enzyme E1 A